jgi:hypothetical protein
VNSHNADKVIRDESILVVADDERVRVLRADVANEAELSIDDDFDLGGDPYNSTGRHVILNSDKYGKE